MFSGSLGGLEYEYEYRSAFGFTEYEYDFFCGILWESAKRYSYSEPDMGSVLVLVDRVFPMQRMKENGALQYMIREPGSFRVFR